MLAIMTGIKTVENSTITQGELLRQAIQRLEAAGVPDARRNAEWMLCEVLGCSRAQLYAYPERSVDTAHRTRFAEMLARRLRREPLQYVLGYVEFLGLRLEVGPGVLVPRPETEWLTERVLQELPSTSGLRVLDIGTGSGCIALAIKYHRPDADVWACDISLEALAIARRNAERLGLEVHWVEADVLALSFSEKLPGPFDLIVSNPPYLALHEADELPPEVRDYEPSVALYAGADPLRFYRALACYGQVLLTPGGRLACEVHAHHGADVVALFEVSGYEAVELVRDLAGNPRLVWARRPDPVSSS